jgi:hypothetical protein
MSEGERLMYAGPPETTMETELVIHAEEDSTHRAHHEYLTALRRLVGGEDR